MSEVSEEDLASPGTGSQTVPEGEVCPKCGASVFIEHQPILVEGPPDIQFACNSMQYSNGCVKQTDKCRIRELTATVAKLTEENAALLRQWNELDLRNEKKHREWSAEVQRLTAELERVTADNERFEEAADKAIVELAFISGIMEQHDTYVFEANGKRTRISRIKERLTYCWVVEGKDWIEHRSAITAIRAALDQPADEGKFDTSNPRT